MTESEKKTLQQTLREAWLNALGVVTHAEDEVKSAAHRILEAVGLAPKPGDEPAPGEPASAGAPGEAAAAAAPAEGGAGEAAGEPAGGFAAELLHRLRKNQEALEHRVQEAVKAAITRVRTPMVEEIGVLRARLEELGRRVEALKQRRKGGAAPEDGSSPKEP